MLISSWTYIGGIERGERNVSVDNIVRLAGGGHWQALLGLVESGREGPLVCVRHVIQPLVGQASQTTPMHRPPVDTDPCGRLSTGRWCYNRVRSSRELIVSPERGQVSA